MQATLEDFFKALRGSDMEVSLNAQVDAARAVELVGWRDRSLLKSALGTTLAKTIPARTVCDEVFEQFFQFKSFGDALAPDASRNPEPGAVANQESSPRGDDAALAQDAQGSGGQSGGQTLSQLLLSGDLAALAKRMQEAAREVGLNDIWFFTQKGYYAQMIQQAMGLESLQREIAEAQREAGTQERAGQLEHARKRLFAEVLTYVERKLALHGTGTHSAIARQIPAVAQAVARRAA